MTRSARAAFVLLRLALATAGAAACHLAVEAAHGSYAGYAHVGFVPLCLLAASLLAVAACAAWADRAGAPLGPNLWFVRGARDALAVPASRHVAIVLALQLAVTFATETIEHAAATGRPCDGLAWLGIAPAAALALHALVALAAVVGLRGALRGAVAGCDALLRLALVALRAILTRAHDAARAGTRRERPVRRARRPAIERHRALRAPPATAPSTT